MVAAVPSTTVAPQDVYFQFNSLNYLTVSWTAPLNPNGVTGYLFVYNTASGTQKQESINDPALTTFTIQDNDLAGIAPTNVLLAPMMNDNVDGANIVLAMPPPPEVLPPAPSDATVQRTSTTSYQLTWTNSPGNVDGYVISYATTPGGVPTSIDLPPDRILEQILNLPENTDFTFNLYSQRNGLRTQAILTTLPPVTQEPKPPENFFLYQISASSVLLRWDPPSPPDNFFENYVVTYLDSVSGEGQDTVLDSTVTSNVIPDLQGGILYDFRVVTQVDNSAEFQLSVGAITDEKLQLSWQYSVINVEFVVHLFKDDGTQELNQPVQSALSAVIQGLMPDSTYIIVIEGIPSNGGQPVVLGSDLALTNTQPNSNVAVGSETSTSVTLSWAATPLATNYRVSYIRQDNAGTGVLNSPAPASVVSGLQPQTSYIFSVVAIIGNVEQNVGSAVGMTTTGMDGAEPKPPENFLLYQISASSVLLRWDPPSPPDNSFENYVVTYLDSVTGEGQDTVLDSTVTSYVIPDLQGGILYDFRVVTQVGTQRSVIIAFTALPLDNSAEFQLSVGAITDEKLQLSWQYSVINVEFVVHLFKDDGTQELNQAVQSSLSTVIQGLMPDSTYIIVIEGMPSNGGQSTVLGSDLAKTNTIPNSIVMVDSKTSTSVTLSWAAIPTTTNYRISYISQDNAGTGVLNSPTPTSVVTGLQLQTSYTFSVVATSGLTEGNVGSIVETTATVTNVAVNSVTSDTITLSWTSVEDTVVYQILYSPIIPGGVEDQRSSLTNTITLVGLTPMTQYNITSKT
ncbi:tenascin-R-like [Strongylocentrotus purpuratus]|uniref:Fibronectin type-III domain-containing protein n=1 Tax=Strongylocentrotus purpuratus TaxID=7668 RepID=A0A7M7SYL4_STRPU|nr:tenascin-R-like [Strongylocentrotus purpuratus]